jgi:hypothetical protein
MVLAEAMAAGVPAVALDAPGAREVVHDRNGRLLAANVSEAVYAAALAELTKDRECLQCLRQGARESAGMFSIERCADRLLEVYERLTHHFSRHVATDPAPWDKLLGRLEIEWNLLVEKTAALAAVTRETPTTKAGLQ